MVNDHISKTYEFVCVEDSPYPGFWAKIDLFKPGRFSGRVLYLDLDVTIVGSLDEIVDYPTHFGIIKDWNLPGNNSSVMAWDAGIADHIYTRFTPEVMDRLHGDQNWISENIMGTVFPRHWAISYKKHVRPTGEIPKDTKVVVYHGQPKP